MTRRSIARLDRASLDLVVVREPRATEPAVLGLPFRRDEERWVETGRARESCVARPFATCHHHRPRTAPCLSVHPWRLHGPRRAARGPASVSRVVGPQSPCGVSGENPRPHRRPVCCYCTSSKILNIGRYIAMTTTPTMPPTPIIMIGSMIEVSDFSIVATSSS